MKTMIKKLFVAVYLIAGTTSFAIIEIKGKQAAKIVQKIDKEVANIFLNKTGGWFKKSLTKDGLTASDISKWDSIADEIRVFSEGKTSSGLKENYMTRLNPISQDIIESIHRINDIYKKFPKQIQSAASGEIQFLKTKSLEATKIGGELTNLATLSGNHQDVIDAFLVVARFANALQEICNHCIKLINSQQ
jgi:hypothetical protein